MAFKREGEEGTRLLVMENSLTDDTTSRARGVNVHREAMAHAGIAGLETDFMTGQVVAPNGGVIIVGI